MLVHDGADLANALLEDAVRRGVGHHERRQFVAVLVRLGAQVGQIDVAVGVARHDNHLQPGHGGARRVRPVRRGRDEDDRAPDIAAVAVIGANRQQAGKLSLGARIRLQRHGVESGDAAQSLFELTEDLRVALDLRRRRKRMDARELGPRHRDHLRRRVELHRARAERDHGRVQPHVLALERADVPHHLRLGVVGVEDRMRQIRGCAPEPRRDGRRRAVGDRDRRRGLAHRLGKHSHDILGIAVGDGFVEGNPDAGRRVAKVDAASFGKPAHRGRVATLDPQRVEVGRVRLVIAERRQRALDSVRRSHGSARRSRGVQRGHGRPRTSRRCWPGAPARYRCSTSPSRAGCAARASGAPCGRPGGHGHRSTAR